MRRVLAAAAAILAAGFVASGAESLYNVRDYGARGDGKTLDTEALNKAVEQCHARGGGTVFLPAGAYLSGTVALKSNVRLHLDSGATLLGSPDYRHYTLIHIGGNYEVRALIYAGKTRNVAVTGHGTIDGNRVFDAELMAKHIKVKHPDQLPGWVGGEWNRGPHTIAVYESSEVILRDVQIRDSGNYAVRVRDSEQILIDNVRVTGGWDGFNLHHSRYVTISNCRLETGDDAIAGSWIENMTVSNCILNSSVQGFRLMLGNRNILINNCTIFGPGKYIHPTARKFNAESGFTIEPYRRPAPGAAPAPEDTTDGIHISNVTIRNVRKPFRIGVFSGNAPLRNITLDNVTVSGGGKQPAVIAGAPDNPVENVSLRHVRIVAEGGVTSRTFPADALSFSCSNAKNLSFHDVSVSVLAPDSRPVMICSRVNGLHLDGFSAPAPPNGGTPVLLRGVTGLRGAGEDALLASASKDPPPARRSSAPPAGGPVSAPFKTTGMEPLGTYQRGTAFFISPATIKYRYADEYDAIYLPRALPERGAVTVKLTNPEGGAGWTGRAGIVVRNDIAGAFSPGYVVLAASSGNGWSLQWDSDGDGILDQHTPFAGYTEYPTWLKLERDGNQFTGYYRTEHSDWIRVGSAIAGKTSRLLDAGIFAMGRSAAFDEFAVTPSR